MIVCEIISEYGGPHCSSTTSLLPKTGCSVVSLQEKGWDKSPSLSIVFGLSSKTQWLSELYYADFINFYSPTQLCGGGTTKSNSNEWPISVPLSFYFLLYLMLKKILRKMKGRKQQSHIGSQPFWRVLVDFWWDACTALTACVCWIDGETVCKPFAICSWPFWTLTSGLVPLFTVA